MASLRWSWNSQKVNVFQEVLLTNHIFNIFRNTYLQILGHPEVAALEVQRGILVEEDNLEYKKKGVH